MGYEGSFSGLDPAELLSFVRSQARAVLGADGNAWIRLVDVAAAGMRRSRRAEDRASYAEAAIGALDGMRSSSGVPGERWAVLAVKVRVDWTLLSGHADVEKNFDASAAYEIMLGQLNAVGLNISLARQGSLRSDGDLVQVRQIKRMATQLARVEEHLTAEQRETVRAWADVDLGTQG
ncbi:hypothetical protein [Streptomyces sp. NPDC101776]|uniref:hypothetical protein n=1 Tax=Streptomyces sp. NPDC101776 TaxID=3366146 RepID=UPI00382C5893